MADWETLPGETPLDDISGLKVKGVATRAELNKIEAENIRKAVVKYFSNRPSRRGAPFDLAWALRLHREMFGDVWRWAGQPRTCDLNLGVPFPHVEARLYDLLKNLEHWAQGGVSLEEQTVMLHHQAVLIHPFVNGNGRWARLLANI